MFKYFHIATKEWVTSEEIQKRLDKGFEFKCNECGKVIGEHLTVLADGIFCPKCRDKITEDL